MLSKKKTFIKDITFLTITDITLKTITDIV